MQRAATIPHAEPGRGDPAAALRATARGAAIALHAMLQQQLHRIRHLHSVTAPAAALLLLPHVDAPTAGRLAGVVLQGVIASFAALGAPFAAPDDDGSARPTWRELVEAAAFAASVHTLKLIAALRRCTDDASDRSMRAVARRWLLWR